MYVRIARFEGGSAGTIQSQVDEIRAGLEASRRGEQGSSMPPELVDSVARVEMLVDRERGATAMAIYCETEEQVRRADSVLNGMSPGDEGMGHRVSADIYEVAFDESTRLRDVA